MSEELVARIRGLARRAGFAKAPTPVLVAAFMLLAVAVVAALVRWWPQPSDAGPVVSHAQAAQVPPAGGARAGAAPSASAAASAPATATVCVHVVGAVRHAGVYTLSAGSRAEAALDAAGGPAADAAEEGVNLAALLTDGEQLVVPTKEQVKTGAIPAPVGAAGTGPSGQAPGAPGQPININTADATQLDALPGVGPSTAAKIVADRQSNGPFKSPDDLGRVPGIGPKKLDQLKSLVCVR